MAPSCLTQALPCARKTGVASIPKAGGEMHRCPTAPHVADQAPRTRLERPERPRAGEGGTVMTYRSLLAAIALTALSISSAGAQIFDYSKYPNLKGQWGPIGGPGR